MKNDFLSFWQDLGFGELFFFYLDSYYKSIQKLIFQLLARSWFWRMLNSNYKSIQKLFFSAFGKILVLVNAFFYLNSNYKSIQILFFQLLARLGFGECFSLFNF